MHQNTLKKVPVAVLAAHYTLNDWHCNAVRNVTCITAKQVCELTLEEDLKCWSCAQKRQADEKWLVTIIAFGLPVADLFPITDFSWFVLLSILSEKSDILIKVRFCFLLSELPPDDWWSDDRWGIIHKEAEVEEELICRIYEAGRTVHCSILDETFPTARRKVRCTVVIWPNFTPDPMRLAARGCNALYLTLQICSSEAVGRHLSRGVEGKGYIFQSTAWAWFRFKMFLIT